MSVNLGISKNFFKEFLGERALDAYKIGNGFFCFA